MASGRSMAKLPTFDRISCRTSPRRNLSYSSSRSLLAVWPVMSGMSKRLLQLPQLLEVLADDQHLLSRVAARAAGATTSSLAGFSLAMRYLLRHSATAYSMRSGSGRATRISVQVASAIQPRVSSSRHGTSYFFGPIRLKTSPSAVLADQRRGQAEPPAGLDLGRDAEDRGGQQVHLVVDDQAPVALVEQLEVRELLVLVGPMVRIWYVATRDRADVLGLAGVLGDLVLGQVGLVEDLAMPLLDGGDARWSGSASISASGPWRRCRRWSCRRRRAAR